MNGPINTAKTPGERAQWWERWALGAGLVVTIGLLIESGPELAHSVVCHVWPSRGTIGNLIVVLGVAGEVLFSWRAVRAAREAELEAEHTVADLEARTAEANERTANLQLEIANARERQAEAERLLADLRLDRVPRSASFMPRTFAGVLESAPKGSVEIMYPRHDEEAHELAKNILLCFAIAEWKLSTSAPIPIPEHPFDATPSIAQAGGMAQGITVRSNSGINEGWFKTVTDAFDAVKTARGVGTQFKVSAVTDINLPAGLVRIIVGPKF